MLEHELEHYDFELTIPRHSLSDTIEEHIEVMERITNSQKAIKKENEHIQSWRKIDTLSMLIIGSVLAIGMLLCNFQQWLSVTMTDKIGISVLSLVVSMFLGFMLTAAVSEFLPNQLKQLQEKKNQQDLYLSAINTALRKKFATREFTFEILMTLDKILLQMKSMDQSFQEYYTVVNDLKARIKNTTTENVEDKYNTFLFVLYSLRLLPENFKASFQQFYAEQIKQKNQDTLDSDYQQYLKDNDMKMLLTKKHNSFRHAI